MDKRTALLAGATVTLIWLLYAVFFVAQVAITRAVEASGLVQNNDMLTAFASVGMWIPLTFFLLWAVERFPLERGRVAGSSIALTGAVGVVVLARALGAWMLNPWIGWYQDPPSLFALLRISLANNFLLSWLLIGVAHAWLFARRAAQRDAQSRQLRAMLTQARLDALSAQLNPHFLFNALNSIAEMVHRDADAADRMLVSLGGLLRASLEHREVPWVTIREELRLLGHYLDIERCRLGDRLQVEWTVDPEVERVPVPPLLLQPLAENAILHALSLRVADGMLSIEVWLEGSSLAIEISDNGGVQPSAPRHGTGLANLRERLRHAYGQEDLLQLLANAHGGTTARLRLPVAVPQADAAVAGRTRA